MFASIKQSGSSEVEQLKTVSGLELKTVPIREGRQFESDPDCEILIFVMETAGYFIRLFLFKMF